MGDEIQIMCVDDEESSLASTVEYIRELDDSIAVIQETDPEQALKRLPEEDIDCLVADYKMPGMDGIDLLSAVRSEYPALPFIFYTGRGSEQVASEAISNDATDYVRKSVDTADFELLVNRIQSAVNRYHERLSYRELFEKVGVGIIVYDIESYEVVEANQSYYSLVGYENRTASDVGLMELTADRNGYDAARMAELFEAAVATGSHDFEWPLDANTGDVVWADVSLEVGEVLGEERILATVRDITERRQREDQLREFKDRLDMAVDGASLAVWDWDIRNDQVRLSGQWEEIFGKPQAEIEPTIEAWIDAIHPDDCDEVVTEVEHGGKETYDLEYRVQNELTGWTWIQTIGRVVEWDGDTPVRAVGIHMDIDERKRSEQQLKQQRDNLETLNEMVRHDIRNDLQLVLTYLEILEGHVSEDGDDYLETALDSAQTAIDLTDTARELSEAMLQVDTDRQPIPLRETLHRQIDEARSTESNVIIDTADPTPRVSVMANEMLESVFRNLLKNAIQHNDKDVPEVTVSVTEHEETVEVSIADNGPGIPDELKQTIFGKGERLNSDGTGVGLYLVETLLSQYGGEVWVEDNEPEGSIFTVELEKANPD